MIGIRGGWLGAGLPVAALRTLNPAAYCDGATAVRALSLLLLEPTTERYLRVDESPDRRLRGSAASPSTRTALQAIGPRWDDAREAATRLRTPHSRVFVNRAVAKNLRGDVLTALAVWAATQSVSLSTGLALLCKLLRTIKLLDEASLDLVLVVTAAADSATANMPRGTTLQRPTTLGPRACDTASTAWWSVAS